MSKSTDSLHTPAPEATHHFLATEIRVLPIKVKDDTAELQFGDEQRLTRVEGSILEQREVGHVGQLGVPHDGRPPANSTYNNKLIRQA